MVATGICQFGNKVPSQDGEGEQSSDGVIKKVPHPSPPATGEGKG